MVRGRLQTAVLGTIATAIVCGCHSKNSDGYPTWATQPRGYFPKEVSSNAFDAYALAADQAEISGAAYLDRVSFFPGQRHQVTETIQESVSKIISAAKKPFEFRFVAHKPFEPIKYQRGWRLIGRSLLWTVQDACIAADFDKAISAAVVGTRFGFDLTGGGATDASLGLAIADDMRKAIAPYMAKLSPVQLDRLAKGIKQALDNKPPITNAVKNEQENVLQAIQFLQDSLRDGTLKTVKRQMGPDVSEAIQYLEPLAENPKKRIPYFESLAKAADIEFAQVQQNCDLPVSGRPKPITKYDAPWKKLAKHIFGAARPLVEINDATVARTRLLILYAQINRLGIRNKAFPTNLDGFTKAITIDPYSGSPFLYHADQAEFSLYSVGKNGRDDGGDTDSTYTEPDLRLECPAQ